METKNTSRMSMTDPKCTVQTRQSLMKIYVWLYILSVAVFIIAFIIDILGVSYRFTYQILMVVGAIGVLIATIIWGFDRRCITTVTNV